MKKEEMAKLCKKLNLTEEQLKQILNSKCISSEQADDAPIDKWSSFNDIASIFDPLNERVLLRDVAGISHSSKLYTLEQAIDALDYRRNTFLENLGELSYTDFYRSLTLNSSNFSFLEKNGNYYVIDDGRHRAVSMMFQYQLEKLRGNPKCDELFVVAPVKHFLDCSKFGPQYLEIKRQLRSNLIGMALEEFDKFGGKNICTMTYRKNTNILCCQIEGAEFGSPRQSEIVSFIKNKAKKITPLNITRYERDFTLGLNHIIVKDVPVIKLKDTIIRLSNFVKEKIRLNTSDYVIVANKTFDKFDLKTPLDYFPKHNDMNLIDEYISEMENHIYTDKLDTKVLSQNGLFTGDNLSNLKYDGLTLEELKDVVTHLNKLVEEITKPYDRKPR